MLWLQQENDSSFIIPNTGRFPLSMKKNLQKEPRRFNFRGKSSSLDFKTQKETPSFSNNFQLKKSFESSLIPRVSFQNETKFFRPRWKIFRHSLLHNTWLCFLKPWAESFHEFSKSIFKIRFRILLMKTISRIKLLYLRGSILFKENKILY